MPYLSIVIAASNAGYGGDFINRFQRCLENKWFGLPGVEIIIVEWNPPVNRPFLNQVIDWKGLARVIRVPNHLHNRFFNPGGFPFLEYTAKNVGIRRATGSFILCTNADVIFGTEMVSRLNRQDFSEECFYRANRHDIGPDGYVFQVNYANGSFHPGANPDRASLTGVPWSENMPHFNAAGDFMMMSRNNWFRLRGYPENKGYLVTLDGEMVHIALGAGLQQEVLPEPIMHQYHSHDRVDRRPWYHPPAGWSDTSPRGTMNLSDDWGLDRFEL